MKVLIWRRRDTYRAIKLTPVRSIHAVGRLLIGWLNCRPNIRSVMFVGTYCKHKLLKHNKEH